MTMPTQTRETVMSSDLFGPDHDTAPALFDLSAEQSATAWRWAPRWDDDAPVAVRSAEHLTVLISLQGLGDVGSLTHSSRAVGRWGHTTRTPFGWVVEIMSRPVSCESMNTWLPGESADILWAWAHGSPPPHLSTW